MKKLISIFLTTLILMSSTGITYAQHFCGGFEMISEITLGHKHMSCGMQMDEVQPKTSDCNTEITKKGCCDNQYTSITTDDSFAKATSDVELNKTFVAAFVSVFVLQVPDNYPSHTTFFAEYNPPPLEQDFQTLYETFLI